MSFIRWGDEQRLPKITGLRREEQVYVWVQKEPPFKDCFDYDSKTGAG